MTDLVCVHRWGAWVKLMKPLDSEDEPAFRECRTCKEHQFSGTGEPRVVIGRLE